MYETEWTDENGRLRLRTIEEERDRVAAVICKNISLTYF